MPLCVHAVPDQPESANAVVIAQRPAKSVFQVSWKPPMDGTHIAKYLVTVGSHVDDPKPIVIQELVPGVSAYHLYMLVSISDTPWKKRYII